MKNITQNNNQNTKGNAKRSAFLKYYFSEEIDGKTNLYFSNAKKSALKVGYSESYAGKILSRMEKQNNPEGQKVAKVRKSLAEAFTEKGIDTNWLASLIYRLGSKTEKRIINQKIIDTLEPDSQGAKIALDFIAKTQGLYEPEVHITKFANHTKEQLIDFIVSKFQGKIKQTY